MIFQRSSTTFRIINAGSDSILQCKDEFNLLKCKVQSVPNCCTDITPVVLREYDGPANSILQDDNNAHTISHCCKPASQTRCSIKPSYSHRYMNLIEQKSLDLYKQKLPPAEKVDDRLEIGWILDYNRRFSLVMAWGSLSRFLLMVLVMLYKRNFLT